MESVQSQCSHSESCTSMTSEYDVFLSFRGSDTRLGIVDHLYHCMIGAGLCVFKDDKEIHTGKAIGGELKRAIVNSRLYAVVFSRNYASSVWCLRELNMMVDLHGSSNVGGKIILPIFCGANPADVKLRTELYREALDTHKGRHGHEIVKKWEEALLSVGRISGWDSKAIQGEGRFVQLIVQDIIGKLRIKDQSLPVHLTGIDDRVSDMLNLLDCNSMGVRLLVLHGMGGIGKTTLARVVFNNLYSQFEGSSFISNIRESSTGHGGIGKLQNKLWRDILGGQYARSCNSDDEFGDIIRRIRSKRMLLVLDDVDDLSQLNKLVGNNPEDTLGICSRVIITTRDKSVCNDFIHSGSKVVHFYEMEKMDDNHALQLFSKHAFVTDEPPEDYLSLSKQVVKTTGNLPLAVEVIAGHLCCQSKESWKHTLEKLKNVPPKKVFEILKVSYEGLDFREREIFLDIACFQPDMPRKYTSYLWEARKLYPKCKVMVLINKSLIKIDSNGEFWIHDQLRDMGREIIQSESLGISERCTRLWNPDDALKIVLQEKVSDKIIAMNLGREDKPHELSCKNFRGLSNLLYLHLDWTTQLIGDFENLRERLMWLSWIDCTQQLNSEFFKMSNLVVLKITGVWGWSVEKLIMPELKVLEIQESDMKKTPDVSYCLKLQIMVFEHFDDLNEIHHSVGKLESLTYMKIYWCRSLRSLPKELCYARALRELIVTETNIEEVPESIGRLESLRTLNLRNNKIRILPASICNMKNLLVLEAACNPLDKGIPEELGSLLALEYLDLSFSRIRFLPTTVSKLSSLKSLKLHYCYMLQELPGLPISLTVLDAAVCPLDKGIQEEIGRLSALEYLDLSRSKIRLLPSTVSPLSSLKSLILQDCDMLHELPRLHTSLTKLTFSSKSLRAVPNLAVLQNITELMVSDGRYRKKDYDGECLELSGLGSLKKLKSLELCPSRIITFGRSSELGSLSRLKNLDLSFPDMASVSVLPSSLCKLTLLHSCTTIPWERYSNLRLLTELVLINLTVTDIELGGLDSLPSLTTLSIGDCDSLLQVSNLGRLSGLKWLTFRFCRALVEIPGLEQLELLEGLTIWSCGSICGTQDLLGLKRLKSVKICHCSSWLRVPRMIEECHLHIDRYGKLQSFYGTYSEYEQKSKASKRRCIRE